MITRRGFIGGLLAAPAIAKAGVLMPVKPVVWTPKKGEFVMAKFMFYCKPDANGQWREIVDVTSVPPGEFSMTLGNESGVLCPV